MGNYHARCGAGEKPEVVTPEAYLSLLGKIPEFPQKISTCRKYNISTTIVLQSIAQIKMLYKDDYETIIGNCDTAICLGTNEQTTADYFSKKLGKATITARNKSTQVGKSGGSLSFNQTGRELMTPDEIMTMPFDECIVMMNHISPFYDKKYPLEKHPQFKYTGDASKENLYKLEDDDEFTICDEDVQECDSIARDEAEEKIKDKEKREHNPKTLKEVLGDALLNVPEEDGYFLIKDVDSEVRKTMFSKARNQLNEQIDGCINNKYKTVFCNMGDTDVILLKALVVSSMNRYQIDDIVITCNGIASGHNCYIGTKSDDSNIMKAMDKMGYSLVKKSADDNFTVYSVNDVVTEEKLDSLERCCKQGHQIFTEPVDDSIFDDY